MIGNRCRAKDYCCEDISNIENYYVALHSMEEYDCHHRLESHDENGVVREKFITKDDLKKIGRYYNVPASELIFIPRSEHIRMHSLNRWNNADFKNKSSESMKGNKNPFYGKHHSKDTLERIRSTKEKNGTLHKSPFEGQCHSEESRKKMSEAKKGRHWYNNGEISTLCFECPDGFKPGRV